MIKATTNILISDHLTDVLKGIEDESLVAKLLLQGTHFSEDLVENPVNYISISRDDLTKISYLSKDRMSDLPESEYWRSSRRFQVKPGAFITKVFKNIPAKEVEKFSNLFRSQSNKPKFEFKIVNGEGIRRLYYYESYASDRGTLGASCMKHEGCQKYLDIYTDNSDKISMLAMFNSEGGLMGRALLWNFESYKIMDRIYTIGDEDLAFYFKQWATKNGYLYKSEQNWYNTLQFEQVGQKKQELKLEVNLGLFNYRYFPYMDTFKFIDTKTGTLYNHLVQKSSVKVLCSSEGGLYENDYLRFDEIDKVLRHSGDCAYVGYLGIYTSANNLYYSEINDQYILPKDSIRDDILNDYIFNDEFERLNNRERIESHRKEIIEYNERRKEIKKVKLSGHPIVYHSGYYDIDEVNVTSNNTANEVNVVLNNTNNITTSDSPETPVDDTRTTLSIMFNEYSNYRDGVDLSSLYQSLGIRRSRRSTTSRTEQVPPVPTPEPTPEPPQERTETQNDDFNSLMDVFGDF